jgi:hypothetical protein
VQRAGQRDIGDVVPGLLGHRPVLAPARHPPVDELRVAREAFRRPEAQPLGHPRAVPLDQHVGRGRQVERRRHRLRALEVQNHRFLAAAEHIEPLGARRFPRRRAVHPDDLGTEVREDHPGERPRAEPGELHDAAARQRTHENSPGI